MALTVILDAGREPYQILCSDWASDLPSGPMAPERSSVYS